MSFEHGMQFVQLQGPGLTALMSIANSLAQINSKMPPTDSVLQQLNEELILENKELHAQVMKDQRFKDKL